MNQREIDEAQQAYIVNKAVGTCLHIGCGMKRIEGAVNLDPNPERWRWADVAAVGDRLPFADGVFDSVVSSHVLNLFPDIEKALHEMTRVLKVGGRMAHVVPDWRHAPDRLSSNHRFERQANGWYGPTDFRLELTGLLDVLLVATLENFVEFEWSFKFEGVKL